MRYQRVKSNKKYVEDDYVIIFFKQLLKEIHILVKALNKINN